MKKSGIAAIATAAVLLVGGGTAYALTTNGPESGDSQPTVQSAKVTATPTTQESPTPVATESEAPVQAAELPGHITKAGEVCDPRNLNDSLCSAFYPDQALINVTDRGTAALSALPFAEKRKLADQACAAYASGGSSDSAVLVTGDDNRTLFSAAAVAYCPEYATSSPEWPDRTQRLIAYYQGLGESGAKADFRGGRMPAPEKLGY